MAGSLAWQTHLPNSMTDDTSICREACRGLDNIIQLASHLVRGPYSRSGRYLFESLAGQNLLFWKWKTLGFRSSTLVTGTRYVLPEEHGQLKVRNFQLPPNSIVYQWFYINQPPLKMRRTNKTVSIPLFNSICISHSHNIHSSMVPIDTSRDKSRDYLL